MRLAPDVGGDGAGRGGGDEDDVAVARGRGRRGEALPEVRAGARGARFERGVSIAASLVSHFTDERAELALTLGDEEGRYGAGREHLYGCLRRLALVKPAAESRDERSRPDFWQRIAPPPSATGDGYVILITAAPPGTIPANVWRKSHVIYV